MAEAVVDETGSPSETLPATAATRRSGQVIPYHLAMLGVVLLYWSVDIVSPALPAIRESLGLTAAGAGLVFSAMFLGRLVGTFPATWMLDRTGAPMTAIGGSLLLGAGSLLAAISPGLALLLAGRLLQGLGLSLVINAAMRSILQSRPAEGAAMTWFGVASTIGGLCGLAISGLLTERLGWQAIFYWSAALALVVAGLSMLAIVRNQNAVAASRAIVPRIDLSSVSLRMLSLPLLLNLAVFVNYSIWVVLPLYAERKFQASAEQTASLLMVITAVHLIAALPVGRVIRRTGSAVVLLGGLACSMVGTILVPVSPSMIWLAIPLGLYGIGQIAAVNAGGDIVLRRGNGTNRSIGFLRFSSDLGLVVGPVAAGALVDGFGYRAPFIALPLMMLIAALLAGRQVRYQRSTRHPIRIDAEDRS